MFASLVPARIVTRQSFLSKEQLEDIAMNKVMLTGRLTRNPEIRHLGTDNALKLAKYTLAVDRRIFLSLKLKT